MGIHRKSAVADRSWRRCSASARSVAWRRRTATAPGCVPISAAPTRCRWPILTATVAPRSRSDVEDGEVCFSVRVRRHRHAEPWSHPRRRRRRQRRHRGPPVRAGRRMPGRPGNDELEARRRLEDCVTADPALLEEIAANPTGYYVNLHNARFPGGAIRGQTGGLADSSRGGRRSASASLARPASGAGTSGIGTSRAARGARPGCAAGAPTTPVPRASTPGRTARRRASGRRRGRR